MENNSFKSTAGQAMGTTALVLGIVAVIAAFIPCFGLIAIVFGVLAIVFGAIGLSQAKKGNAPQAMPVAGLILGIVATLFVIIWMLIVAGTIGTAIMANKDEIGKAFDSLKVEVERSEDSIEVENDTITWNDSIQAE
ncbi:hypothetical protein ACFSX9_11650 [Flavobacterium ardleyense]|uniref:DUF4190 domain-containing protein n=1 Tax=Flavobacterium ardleyense TaxID=2038737 RepID=A0ABW5Z9J3_9FLAO